MHRIIPVDIMKGICIILVVMGHYLPDDSPGWYVLFNDLLYRFHMPLFMFLSGLLYCVTMRPESYIHLVRRKALRLMVPYFFVSVLIIALKLATPGQDLSHPVGWNAFGRMFYYPEAAYVLWFIWALWLIFLAVPLLRTVRARDIFFIISLVLWVMPVYWPREIFCIGQTIDMLPYFAAGMFAWDHRSLSRPILGAVRRLPWVAVVALVGFYLLTDLVPDGIVRHILDFIVAFSGIAVIAVIAIALARNGRSRSLLKVGECSFIIFLFHTTFIGLAKSLLWRAEAAGLHLPSWTFSLEVLLMTAVGVLVPMWLYDKILTRNKVLAFLTSTKYHPPLND